MSTVPAVPGGAVATRTASDRTLNASAAAGPNCTPFAPVKPLPLTVTTVPPAALLEVGGMPVTTGGEAFAETKGSAPPVEDVPPKVVTVTSTAASACRRA